MDPNATLARIRALVAQARDRGPLDGDDAEELAALVEALDEWLTRGGFLPVDWQSGNVAALGHPRASYTRSVTYRSPGPRGPII
jgi:hypothetical protein